MTFEQIQGNEDVKRALSGMIESGKVPHAILFHEEDGGGAVPVALAFLEMLFGEHNRIPKLIHPDVHFVFPTASGSISEQYMDRLRPLILERPLFTEAEMAEALGIEGKNSLIAVSEAKHLLEALSLSALEGGYRAVLIYLPEKMNQETANRLLKLIEEPPAKTQFLLVTHAPEKVLLTISSRCQRIRVCPSGTLPAAGFAEEELFDELMDALLEKNLPAALEAGDRIAALSSRDSVKTFCRSAADTLRRIFLVQQGMSRLSDGSSKAAVWAAKCRRTFPRQAHEAFSRAISLIDRNVNVKIVATDLVDRLFMTI